MECNRVEAVRAKEIAERKFLAKDFKGAKKYALKAQNLCPGMDGISQMVTTLEVYFSAEEEKINGESNWYGVLGVTPLADDETIRTQYRKLALLLHPDKNRSIGAEGAFTLLSEAWSLLSDKSKRMAYDQRFRAPSQQRNQTTKGGPSPPPMQNGIYSFAKTSASQSRVPKGNSGKRDAASGPYPSHEEYRTFWTVCHRCKVQYEYLRMYLNHHLLCPNCHEAYFAAEVDPPATKFSKTSFQINNSKQRKNASHLGSNAARNNSAASHAGTSRFTYNSNSNHNDFQWAPFSESTGAASAVQAANMVKQAYEKVKREREKAQTDTRKEDALRRKNLSSKRATGAEYNGHSNAAKRRKGVEDCGTSKETRKQVSSESATVQVANFPVCKRGSLVKCTSMHEDDFHVDIKQLLIIKACEEIGKKLNEHISASVVRKAAIEDENSKENETPNMEDIIVTLDARANQNEFCEPVETEGKTPLSNLNFGTSGPYLDWKSVKEMSVNVPNPDFHDFDKDRMAKCFADNQVWAVYDDDDGMPRHYTMIHNVISLDPFKVKIGWLNSITNSRMGHVSWFKSGFSKTCGDFGIGRLEICDSLDSFSHIVTWTKHTSRTIQIFPRKGEVWALYRNWSFEWNELTEDEVIYKYDMVEVLEDFDEEHGVIIIPLVKVAGFKAVFHQHFNPSEVRRIPREEMSRFSHQVPSHLLTGQEGSKSLKGCRELDPAAIPLEILQVMAKIEGIEFVDTEDDNIELVKAVDCDGNTNINMVDAIS